MNKDSRICIIGGGFYGAIIALYLKDVKGFKFVDLYEKESELLTRASYVNQAEFMVDIIILEASQLHTEVELTFTDFAPNGIIA